MNTTAGRMRNVLVVNDRTRRVEDRPLRAHCGPLSQRSSRAGRRRSRSQRQRAPCRRATGLRVARPSCSPTSTASSSPATPANRRLDRAAPAERRRPTSPSPISGWGSTHHRAPSARAPPPSTQRGQPVRPEMRSTYSPFGVSCWPPLPSAQRPIPRTARSTAAIPQPCAEAHPRSARRHGERRLTGPGPLVVGFSRHRRTAGSRMAQCLRATFQRSVHQRPVP
jgi:hypothetical protein